MASVWIQTFYRAQQLTLHECVRRVNLATYKDHTTIIAKVDTTKLAKLLKLLVSIKLLTIAITIC